MFKYFSMHLHIYSLYIYSDFFFPFSVASNAAVKYKSIVGGILPPINVYAA